MQRSFSRLALSLSIESKILNLGEQFLRKCKKYIGEKLPPHNFSKSVESEVKVITD